MKTNKMIQGWKSFVKKAKHRLMPARQKRKETIANLGKHATLLQEQANLVQEQVNALSRSNVTGQQSFHELAQRLYDMQSQLLAEIARQSACQNSQMVALRQHLDQGVLESENRHAIAIDSIQSNLEELVNRIESRLTLNEKATNSIKPFLDSIQSKFDSLDQQAKKTNDRILGVGTELEQMRSLVRSSTDLERKKSSRKNALESVRQMHSATPATTSRFCAASYNFYSQSSSSAPFIYLDVKSVPRSGLHYLQHGLQSILGNQMSFCEWYQEPGCCKQMPCAVTGFANACCRSGSAHLRMIKSHDFDLADPIYPSNQTLRRIVLVRDPVYSLTSYWNLQALKHNQELLMAHGVNPVKVDYLHEKPVLQMAFSLVDSHGSVPSEESLIKWLEESKKYMLGFMSKWGRHVPRESVFCYEQVDDFVDQLMNELLTSFPIDVKDRYQAWKDGRNDRFRARVSPFLSNSQRLSQHLKQHAELFETTAAEIRREDQTGWFANCSSNEIREVKPLPANQISEKTSTSLIPFRETNQSPAA